MLSPKFESLDAALLVLITVKIKTCDFLVVIRGMNFILSFMKISHLV
jgi:hypothetical protein